MRDLYRRLGLDASADDGAVRAALAGADAEMREAAEYILLDPTRRAVYDRNRRVLVTVGHLRAHLGLNLTRFWPRARFGDFTTDLGAAAAPRAAAPADDPMAMAWAFGVAGRNAAGTPHGRPRVAAFAIIIVILLATMLAWWLLHRR